MFKIGDWVRLRTRRTSPRGVITHIDKEVMSAYVSWDPHEMYHSGGGSWHVWSDLVFDTSISLLNRVVQEKEDESKTGY